MLTKLKLVIERHLKSSALTWYSLVKHIEIKWKKGKFFTDAARHFEYVRLIQSNFMNLGISMGRYGLLFKRIDYKDKKKSRYILSDLSDNLWPKIAIQTGFS